MKLLLIFDLCTLFFFKVSCAKLPLQNEKKPVLLDSLLQEVARLDNRDSETQFAILLGKSYSLGESDIPLALVDNDQELAFNRIPCKPRIVVISGSYQVESNASVQMIQKMNPSMMLSEKFLNKATPWMLEKGIFVMQSMSNEEIYLYQQWNEEQFPLAWITNGFSRRLGEQRPTRLTVAQGKELIVAAFGFPPALYKEKGVYVRGVDIDILKCLANLLNFTIVIENQRTFGFIENNIWQGTVGTVLYGDADIGAGHITIASQRYEYIDYTTITYGMGPVRLLSRAPQPLPGSFSLTKPFQPAVWLLLLTAAIGCSLVMSLINSKALQQNWMAPVMMLLQQSVPTLGMKGKEKLLMLFWAIFTVVMWLQYTSNLTAFMVAVDLEPPLDSLADALEQGKHLYITPNTSIDTFFQKTQNPTNNAVYEQTMKNKYFVGMEPNTTFGLEGDAALLSGKGFVLSQSFFAPHHNGLVLRNVDTFKYYRGKETIFEEKFSGLVLKKFSPLKDPFDDILHILKAGGLIDHWYNIHSYNKVTDASIMANDVAAKMLFRPLQLRDTKDLFLVLTAGSVLATLGITMEKIWMKMG